MKHLLLVTTVLLLAVSLLRPPWPNEQTLQHAPTVIAILLLFLDARSNHMTKASFCCVTAFLWLHILGARYIYSFVPYDDLSVAVFGTSVSEHFGWERNHFDRFVHLCFGGLLMVPARDIARAARLPPGWSIVFALCAVTTLSALYEVCEWLLTVVMSPVHADAYNGQQGDSWDAQKDMALAFVGSLFAGVLLFVPAYRQSCLKKKQ